MFSSLKTGTVGFANSNLSPPLIIALGISLVLNVLEALHMADRVSSREGVSDNGLLTNWLSSLLAKHGQKLLEKRDQRRKKSTISKRRKLLRNNQEEDE